MSSTGSSPTAGTAFAVLGLFIVLIAIVAFFGYCALVGLTHVLGVSTLGAAGLYVAALFTELSIINVMKALAR